MFWKKNCKNKYFEKELKTFSKNEMIANTEIYLFCFYMNVAEYLSNIFLGQDSVVNSHFIHVIFPVLSITVLMFSLRSFVQESYTPRMKKQ